jgi:hypothetical protein
VCKESADLVQVIVDRCAAYTTFIHEIFGKGAFQARLRVPRPDRRRLWNGARLTKVGQELLQHRTAAWLETASSPGAITRKRRELAFIQRSGTQAMPIKPAVQTSKKPQFFPGVDPAVPLFEKEFGEPVEVTRKWAISKTLDCSWVFEEPRRHTWYTRGTSRLDVGGLS